MAATAFAKLEQLRRSLASPVLTRLTDDDYFQSQFSTPTIPLPSDLFVSAAADLATGNVRFSSVPDFSTADVARIAKEIDGSPQRIAGEIWADRLRTQQRRAAANDDSLNAHVDLYLKQIEQRANAGDMSQGNRYARQLHLHYFRDWLGRDTDVREIDGPSLVGYHAHLVEKVTAGEWTRTTARHYLVTVKAFVRWLWQMEKIASLPRVMDEKAKLLTISTPPSRIIVFTISEVSSLLKSASDRTKLYILLMLDCGMTQKDVADLRQSEMDWAGGRIIRKRSKTGDYETVPELNYLLWPETLRLLVQERAPKSSDRALLNGGGNPIWNELITPEGKYQKTDNVKNAFDRLRKQLGINKPLKSLKKTSASLLCDNEKYQGLQSIFLGHAPQSMSDRHYTQVPQRLLDQALCWLATQYGLVATEPPKIEDQ
jgi:integrase